MLEWGFLGPVEFEELGGGSIEVDVFVGAAGPGIGSQDCVGRFGQVDGGASGVVQEGARAIFPGIRGCRRVLGARQGLAENGDYSGFRLIFRELRCCGEGEMFQGRGDLLAGLFTFGPVISDLVRIAAEASVFGGRGR